MDAKTNRARRRARAVEVVEEATRVLRADPGDRAALRRRLNAYVSLGWADAAERDATALLAANPDQAKLLAVRAKLRIALGRPADAERDAAALLVLDPHRALALHGAGPGLRAPGSTFTIGLCCRRKVSPEKCSGENLDPTSSPRLRPGPRQPGA